MTAERSRHDHFPRADAARRQRIRVAVAAADADWRAIDSAPGGLLAAIEALRGASADIAVARLLPWLDDMRWLQDRLGVALALLAADPFLRPPLRLVAGSDGGTGGLLLADHGAVRLTLLVRPAEGSVEAPPNCVFVPGRAAIRVIASGGASLISHEVAVSAAEETGGFMASVAAQCHSHPPRPLRNGETLHLDTARQSHSLVGAKRDILLLELAVQPPSPLPIRAYDIASGRLIHVSASRRDSSFRAMALTLLRQFGRTDAAPLFASETRSEDFAARWNAMRELVALDPAATRSRLAAMAAADPHPEVRGAAAAAERLIFPPSGETGREGGGGMGLCTSRAPSTPYCTDHQ
ncbi:MAG: HEAT repeat domain-containing protein [Sphingopyxis sp.]|uniref:HEAT repeat domain-containing protein n=1 Tax=Sphingopyxis sp. TaxID=1908224 RepID=UPI001A2A8E25|nr:HEAT repeat domain-containing protein [Sphingopyxis sp.]MBJ7501756.1 HEAT repeat domain-containing protein [Sphingopyxis sp.]